MEVRTDTFREQPPRYSQLTEPIPRVSLTQPSLYGAHVTSWKTSDGKERLYMSRLAKLDGSEPVRQPPADGVADASDPRRHSNRIRESRRRASPLLR
jgi:hypothetical protein